MFAFARRATSAEGIIGLGPREGSQSLQLPMDWRPGRHGRGSASCVQSLTGIVWQVSKAKLLVRECHAGHAAKEERFPLRESLLWRWSMRSLNGASRKRPATDLGSIDR